MGAGFKDFASGAILTAGDVDNYLMRQTIMTFANASARDTALSAVLDEGMAAYLEDTDEVSIYDGSAWNAIGGGGKILQVVSTTKTDTFSASTSNTFTDVTGLSVTITPSSASNKILVFAQVHGSTTSNGMGTAVLLRDSTQIDLGAAASNRVRASCSIDTNGAAAEVRQAGLNYLDSPATTSAVVYKIAINSADTGGTAYINRSYDDTDDIYHPRVASTITALEVSA